MKKTFIRQILMLLATMAILASCKKASSEYTNAIPADVSALVGINIQSLIDKSGVNDDDKQQLIDAMKGELSAAAFQHIEKIIKNGSESGISIKDPVYLFTSDLIPIAAVMKVNDIGKLEKTLEIMIAEQIAEPATKINGIDIVRLKDGGICIFSKSTFLVTDGRNNEETAIQLMKQGSDESITGHAFYQSMSNKKGDITFLVTMNALPYPYRSQMNITFNNIANVKPEEIGITGGIIFDKGKIAVQTEMVSTNEEVTKEMRVQGDICGKLNETFLSYFPASTLMYVTLNVNGEKLFDMLQANEQFRTSLSSEQVEKMKDVFGVFNGDIALGLIDVTMNDVPTFVAYAQAKNGAVLETLYQSKDDLGIGHRDDIVKLGENEYVYKSNFMNIFFGFKNKYMYATNSELAYKNIGNKEKDPLKNAEFAPNMKGKCQYIVIDMKSILDLPVVKMAAMMGGREMAMYLDIASKVSYLEAIGNGDSQSDINLWLVDKDTNALQQIVDLARQFAGI